MRVLSWAALLPAVTLLALMLFWRPGAAALAAGAAAAAVVLAALLAAGRRDLSRAASAADRQARLHDLLKTSLEVGEKVPDSPWRPLLERRAELAVQSTSAAGVVSIRPPRLPLAMAALLVGAALLVALLPDAPQDALASAQLSDARALPGGLLDASESDELAATKRAEGADEQVVAEELEGTPVEPNTTVRGESSMEASEPSSREERDSRESRARHGSTAARAKSELSASETAATLREEHRSQGADERDGSGPERAGDERSDMDQRDGDGESTDRAKEGEEGAAGGSPSRREIAEQVVAFDLPSPAESQRKRGNSAESALQVAAGGRRESDLGEARDDADGAGAASAGLGTAPQESDQTPLGEASEIAVTLEEVLLAARDDADATERRTRPSRQAEARRDVPPRGNASAFDAGSSELERPALHVPYPLGAHALVREFFTPEPEETSSRRSTGEISG
ncbi:MAG TPA: hypothetical protein VNB06_05435 [Thermoanaerobaculia bacterium]|nr:hypothetical protein [Thermoanaerobaculia bacterium]